MTQSDTAKGRSRWVRKVAPLRPEVQEGHRTVVLSGEEIAARLAVGLQTPGKMQYTMYENVQGQLVFPAPPTPTIQLAHIDAIGKLRQGDVDGQLPFVEGSAGAIKTATESSAVDLGTIDADTGFIKTATESSAVDLGTIDTATGFVKTATEATAADVDLSKRSVAATVPSFHPYTEVPDILERDKWVLFTATGTCDGGGALAAVTLVPALGSYSGVVRIFTVSGNANISGGTLTLVPTGGTLTSFPATVAPVAATGPFIEHEWSHGWYGHGDYGPGTDDNKILGMTGAGLGAGSIIYVQGEYQYVT